MKVAKLDNNTKLLAIFSERENGLVFELAFFLQNNLLLT
jgi:hypothetical protein